MTTTSLGTRLGWLGAGVVAVVALDSAPLLPRHAAVVVDDGAQLAAGLLAAGVCWWTARRAVGGQRTWRLLMAAGMAGWSVGQAIWSWYQIAADTPLPCPSLADAGFVTMPVLALGALLALAGGRPRPGMAGPCHGSLVYLLDGVVVVGSLFVLTWATSLGAVVHASAPTAPAFATAVAYPATDLVLVVIVGLLAVTRRVPEQHGTQLALLGSGLVAMAVSDSIFAYIVASGGREAPPTTNAGFIAGPVLIGAAALTGADEARSTPLRRAPRRTELAHLLLPLALVGVTAALVGGQVVRGHRIDAVEAASIGVVLAVVLVRQAITSVQNAALVDRLSAAQAALAHRAHHDALTGLANRSLFGERLRTAVDRHRVHDRAFSLLVIDLDDFKAVNDRLGHTAGDLVLRAAGERLCACVRSTDTVARLGGDEFAVLLDGASLPASLVSQRVLAALGHPFVFEGWQVSLGASVGVVESGDEPVTPDLLLRRADGAMYVGKRRGKGIAVRYRDELGDELPPLARAPAAAGQPPGGSTP